MKQEVAIKSERTGHREENEGAADSPHPSLLAPHLLPYYLWGPEGQQSSGGECHGRDEFAREKAAR